jgi:hypothetical protein
MYYAFGLLVSQNRFSGGRKAPEEKVLRNIISVSPEQG